MKFVWLAIVCSFLLCTESIATEPNNFDLTKKKCGDLFVPYELPKKISDISVDGFARACLETISSPARLLFQINMLVSIRNFSKTRDEAVVKFNEKKVCAVGEASYVRLEKVIFKFDEKSASKEPFDNLSLSIEAYAWRCENGIKKWPYVHFDINVPIEVISDTEVIGLGAGEPKISFYRGTKLLDWVFGVRDDLEKDIKGALAKLKVALPLTKQQFASFRPQVKRVKYRFLNDVLLADIYGRSEISAPEVRTYLFQMLPK